MNANNCIDALDEQYTTAVGVILPVTTQSGYGRGPRSHHISASAVGHVLGDGSSQAKRMMQMVPASRL